jgi:N-hydroxyarylamine O-acetyltransferase
MLHIPFENLDIALARPISLQSDALIDKLIAQRRGGFCYELNYAFSMLLQALGFECQLLSARVFDGVAFGPEFDHLLLRVVCAGEHWLADVGFGDGFREPLRLNPLNTQQTLLGGLGHDGATVTATTYAVAPGEGSTFVVLKTNSVGGLVAQYAFTPKPRYISDFDEMCRHQQTSPQSHFTQKSVCSIATASGRCSLFGQDFITTDDGVKTSQHVADNAAYARILENVFHITLSQEASISALRRR